MISIRRSEESHGRSLGVAPILLLDGYHREIANRVLPNPLHVSHSRLLEREPDIGGTERDRLAGDPRRHAEDDRIFSIHHIFNFHHRFVARAGGVVTGPFTERAFRSALPFRRHDVTFDRQFGRCRDRQPGLLAPNDLDRFIAQPARDFYFRYPPRFIPAADLRQYRILTESDRHRTRFALRPVFLANQPSMLARGDPDPQSVLVVNTNAISPKIGPLLVGILQDHQTTRADITAAVLLVPTRCGKFKHIDLAAAVDIFSDGSVRYIDRLERLVRTKLPLPSLDHLHPAQRRVQIKSQTGGRRRTDRIHDDPKAFWITFDVVEQHDLRLRRSRRHFGDGADLQIPIRSVDSPQLAETINGVNEPSKVFVGYRRCCLHVNSPSGTTGRGPWSSPFNQFVSTVHDSNTPYSFDQR